MRHFKHYYKLIISTIVVVLVFACHSLVSYADPLTASMIGSGAAMGFGFPGVAGLSPSSIGSTYDIGYTDPVPWDSISHKSVNVVDNPTDPNNVDITLNQDITSAGNSRINQLNDYYGLTPGSVHTIGNFLAYNGYIFNKTTGQAGRLVGPTIGNIGVSTLYVDNRVYITMYQDTSIRFDQYIGNYSSQGGVIPDSQIGQPLYFSIRTNYSPYKLGFAYLKQDNSWAYLATGDLSNTGLSVTSISPSVNRSQDSTLIESEDYENKITIPKSYLSDISYTPGDITDVHTIEEILEQILAALTNDDLLISILIPVTPTPTPTPPPEPTPVPGETIANTPYSILNDVFDDFKEVFGDIYDDVSDFQESFGDWVNDVASGWTEVFGDIYDDLHEFKESFGDWVDDVASGWTEVFGDIYSTLSSLAGSVTNTLQDILSGVQSIVQSIENANFDFIDAFWKNFLTPFNNLFNTIKSHLSIWHYVVEWLASISSVFTFYLEVFSGAGSRFLLPIYACFAGTVVIAVYRRFGK